MFFLVSQFEIMMLLHIRISPTFGSHENCVEYAFSEFLAVCWKLSIIVVANPHCISFHLFIPICNFCKNKS